MEEERKYSSCGLSFTFIFILALPPTFLFLNPSELWQLGDLIFPQIHKNQNPSKLRNTNSTYFAWEISPNLSSCHDSYGRPDLLMNCCPPQIDDESKAIDFQFPDISKSGLRIRRPLHKVDDEFLEKYTKAMNIMKSLPHSDPRSYSRQAIIHCTFCSGAFDMKHYFNDQQDHDVKWPIINIHRQWLFYPFHRMYLHFHERILGSLINDDTFSIPFWNWDNPEAMSFPQLFMSPPFDDTERDPTHFSPTVIDLSFTGQETNTLNSSQQLKANLNLMYNQVVSGAKKIELFMGCPLKPSQDGFCDGPGTIEGGPHNHVHTWVGSADNKGREDMGKFYSAAWDPSFYPHHSNIDRIWEVWRHVHGIDVPIMDPIWLNSYFYFYDENLNLVKIRVRDVLNVTKLGYGYEDVGNVWLKERPKPSVDPKIAKVELGKRDLGLKSVSDMGQSGQRRLSEALRVKIDRPKRVRSKKEEEEVLIVYGIGVDDVVDEIVKFDVYVNLVDETKLGPTYREFVGTFVSLQEEKSRKSTTLKLGISEALEDLEADEDESIWVTIMPRTRSCRSVFVGGVRIELMR